MRGNASAHACVHLSLRDEGHVRGSARHEPRGDVDERIVERHQCAELREELCDLGIESVLAALASLGHIGGCSDCLDTLYDRALAHLDG